MEKREYHTKQKEVILEQLKLTKSHHVTVDDLYSLLQSNGLDVGKTTVYRQLEKLVQQGFVRKYNIENERCCYQYVGENQACSEHFHLKCICCGRLIHVNCNMLKNVSQHMLAEHDFMIDSSKTVFYGKCDACRALEEK